MMHVITTFWSNVWCF